MMIELMFEAEGYLGQASASYEGNYAVMIANHVVRYAYLDIGSAYAVY